MTTYYVRKTGSDAASGLSPALAWLTINHAVNSIASGDTIYIGAGTYRELINAWITASAETSLLGDVDGSHTGDAGEIVVTAYLTNDTTAPSANPTLVDGADMSHWTFRYLTIIGGNTGASFGSCVYTGNTTPPPVNMTFRDCTFWGHQASQYAVFFDNADPNTGPSHLLFERNRVFGVSTGVYYGQLSSGGSGDTDMDIVTRNCIIFGLTQTSVRIEGISSGKVGGGFVFKNNLLIGNNRGAAGDTLGWCIAQASFPISTVFPTLVYNNILLGAGLRSAATNQMTEDYNVLVGGTRSNVTAGAHSISNGSYDAHLLFGQEQSYGAVLRPFGMPVSGSPLLGFGSFDSSVTDDLLQGIRPGSGIGSVSRSVGPFERANSATKNVATLYSTIPQSVQINGPGYQDFQLPVPHGNVNVTIQARFDSTYTGTLPQMKVRNGGECGVADASVTTTGSADTWTQISLSFNTTAVGIVTIRLQSNDTAGAGKAFFAYAVVT